MMTIHATVSAPCLRILLLLTLLAPAFGPGAAIAADKQKADRQLAAMLAERLGVVAAEGQRFAAARDALARARLRTSQRLEDNLISLEEAKALDLRAWEVIGASFRLRLFEQVIAATDEISRQHQERVERRREQERELAETRSAVDFRAAELRAAAKSLAALAEPPTRSDAADLFNQLALQLSGTTGAGADKADGGAILARKLTERVVAQALGDKAIPDLAPVLGTILPAGDAAPAPGN